MKNNFFKKKNNIFINDVLSTLKIKLNKKNIKNNDIKELNIESNNNITLFNSIKYLQLLKNTKSNLIITNQKFNNFIPKKMKVIHVDTVLLSVAKITSLFYPSAIDDIFDINVTSIDKKKFSKCNEYLI